MADELSPAEEARLRRLLARSRHDERLPDDVATRLDDVLARLEAGEDVGPAGTPLAEVHELVARRRRTVASVLVAAAAVVVVGLGLGQVVDGIGGASDATSADEAATAETADRSQGRTDGDDAAGGSASDVEEFSAEAGALGDDGMAAQEALGGLLVVGRGLAEVPEEGFTRAALRLERRVSAVPTASSQGSGPSSLDQAAPRVQRAWQGCAPVDWGEGVAVAVLYEGDPAILVFRPASGESRVVELLQCGTGMTLRSVTLPTR